ncbi:MAG: PKD domain-containing protein [Deltaproteobacteria bacterium]|nr:PKD domain-containing protein [Deltaproteobacteria bacterium]
MPLKTNNRLVIYTGFILLFLITASYSHADSLNYLYDELNRLEQVQYPDGTIIRYSYDNVGNRLEKRSVKPPVADFTASPVHGIDPLAVAFIDQSARNPDSWQWDFGDGATSNLQSPVHTYVNIGNREKRYTVMLTVSNAGGSNQKTRSNYIHVLPDAMHRISGPDPVYYPTIQAAYDDAADGGVIQCKGESLAESINMNRNISVTLDGGYNWDFSGFAGSTTLYGSITVGDGTATIKNFILEK